MKLLIVSDLHVEAAPFEVSSRIEFDVAVLAGDIHAPGDNAIRWIQASPALRKKPVIFVPGNHEYYGHRMEEMLTQMRSMARGSNIHLLDGNLVCIDGVRFLGATLWTDFELSVEAAGGLERNAQRGAKLASLSLGDYRLIRTAAQGGAERMLRPQDTVAIHRIQRAWLRAQLSIPFAGSTVVVTHHAPHRGSLASRHASMWTSTAFVNEMGPEFFETPTMWVHGHTHDSFDYQVANSHIVCNPRGYQTQPGLAQNGCFQSDLVFRI